MFSLVHLFLAHMIDQFVLLFFFIMSDLELLLKEEEDIEWLECLRSSRSKLLYANKTKQEEEI